MAKKQTSFKRSNVTPVVVTEDQKKTLNAYNVTSNIVKYAIIVLVLFSLIFGMLALIKVDVKSKQLDSFQGDKFANISSYDLISGWFAKAKFNYPDRNINIGYQYPHAFDYLVGSVPALEAAIKAGGSISGGLVFGAIRPEQDTMLDMAYVAMLVLEIVTLVWLALMAVLFVLSFVKKCAPSQTLLNISVLVHFVLTFIMWAFTLALSSNSTAEFAFVVGIGMWLTLLVSVVVTAFVVANMIYKAKLKAYEEA